ncbi:hypothetical protein [Streptomyces xinghaiensis]|uniref:hypothetical protein n=1 Tax=Streptomyces xinghaiensis TaxID=1038928 RepID=UPI003430FD84
MPQPTPARTPRCRDCGGFAVVAIDTGAREADGSRVTLSLVCRTCQGTGTTVLRGLLHDAASAAFFRR